MTAPASTPATPAESPAAPATPAKARKPRTARLSVAVAEGTVALYLLRSSGRTRRVPYLPKGEERQAAATLRDQVKAAGLSQAATEVGISTSTLTRRLLALDASEAVDAGKFDALWDGKATEVQFTRGGTA